MPKLFKLVLSLSLLCAFLAAFGVCANQESKLASLLAPAASAAPYTSAAITFKNARGQVISESNRYPLDRIARGQSVTVIVNANAQIKVTVRAANGFRREVVVNGYFCEAFPVPHDPSFDNVTVTVTDPRTGHTLASRRLPIGR